MTFFVMCDMPVISAMVLYVMDVIFMVLFSRECSNALVHKDKGKITQQFDPGM